MSSLSFFTGDIIIFYATNKLFWLPYDIFVVDGLSGFPFKTLIFQSLLNNWEKIEFKSWHSYLNSKEGTYFNKNL